jgi:hypothetical protein
VVSVRIVIAALLTLLLCGSASAQTQCNGTALPGYACGNGTASGKSPSLTPLSSIFSQSYGYVPRIRLTAAITFYVNGNASGTATCGVTGGSTCSAGNDANFPCTTPAAACLTTQKVVTEILSNYDMAGFTATANLAHGTSTNYAFSCFGPIVGSTIIAITGDTNSPDSAVIQPPNFGNGISFKDGCTLSIDAVGFTDSPGGNANAYVSGGNGYYGHADVANTYISACASCTAFNSNFSSSIALVGGNAMLGSVGFFGNVFSGGTLSFESLSIPLNSGLTWIYFIVNQDGHINAMPTTAVTGGGGSTGAKCYSFNGGWEGSDPNFSLPGNSNCKGQIPPVYGVPTIVSGQCGASTNGAVVAGATNETMQITIGSSTTTACAVTFFGVTGGVLGAAPTVCSLTPSNPQAATEGPNTYVSSISGTNFVIVGTALANTNWGIKCS